MDINFLDPAKTRVALSGAFTIYEAAQAKTTLLDALRSNGSVEIDLADVTELDTAAVQVLVLLKRESAVANGSLRLSHGDASLQVIDRYNLGAFFGDPVVVPASETQR